MSERQSKVSKQKKQNRSQVKPALNVDKTELSPASESKLVDTAADITDDTIGTSADLIRDRRYSTVQRQKMAARLGQQFGNRYMQSVLSQGSHESSGSIQRVGGEKGGAKEAKEEASKDTLTQLREALKKPTGAGEILAILGAVTKKERRKIVRDKALIDKMAGKLGQGDLLKAMEILKMPLKDKLEVAIGGWGVDAETIKQLTRDASKKEKKKLLKDKALLGRVSTFLSAEEMVAVLENLNAPLTDKLDAALSGWGIDEALIRKLIVGAKTRELKKLLKNKALMGTLAMGVNLAAMMSILKEAGVAVKERFKLSFTYWKPSVAELEPVVNEATEQERLTVAKDRKLMALAESTLGNLPFLKFLTVLQPAKYIAVGTEVIEVSSEDEATEAKRIIEDVKTNYGVEFNSPAGVEAIKKSYTNAPEKVRAKLKVTVWKYRELVAIEKALASYGPILGSDRASSSRKGVAQEVTTVSKIANAIDTNKPSGKLDTTTLGEYFKDSKNFSMFIAGEKSRVDFKDNKVQLQATAIHEIAHALLKNEVSGYASTLEYWKDEYTKSRKRGAEKPITKYGRTNASEDLSEAMMYYFLNTDRLKTKCPKRFALIKAFADKWKPAVPKATP